MCTISNKCQTTLLKIIAKPLSNFNGYNRINTFQVKSAQLAPSVKQHWLKFFIDCLKYFHIS